MTRASHDNALAAPTGLVLGPNKRIADSLDRERNGLGILQIDLLRDEVRSRFADPIGRDWHV